MNAPMQHTKKQTKSPWAREWEIKKHAFGAVLIPVMLTIMLYINELLFSKLMEVDQNKLTFRYAIFMLFLTIPFALIIYSVSTFFKNKLVNAIILWTVTGATSVYYSTQLIYRKFFGTYLAFSDLQEAGQIGEFWKTVVASVFKNFFNLLVFFLPLIMLIIFRKSIFKPVKTTFAAKIVLVAAALLIQSVAIGILCENPLDKAELKESFNKGTVAERYGILTMAKYDLKYCFAKTPDAELDDVKDSDDFTNHDTDTKVTEKEIWKDERIVKISDGSQSSENKKEMAESIISKEEFESSVAGGTEISGAPEGIILYKMADGTFQAVYVNESGEYQKVKVNSDNYNGNVASLTYQYGYLETEIISYGYNVIDAIDLGKLCEEETDKTIKSMHSYFDGEATQKNKYTGMFEGKNLIYMTCESFCPYFITEERTPALYRMYNEGFKFNNFYITEWAASTGGGEFAMATGLTALKTTNQLNPMLMQASANRGVYFPFTVGNAFKKIGYTAKSYHNHNKNLYERAASHKLWGFDYSYIGHGLNMTYSWPCSDKEMIDASFEDYANDEHFVVDYMTISAHGDYNNWSKIARKNQAVVDALTYPEPIKIYIAASMELEYAMETLISDLEAKGKLDDTVIVMAPDHWPYCLTPEYNVSNEQLSAFYGFTTDNTFEKYHNGLIIWCASMKEPVIVDKPCGDYDILPTVLNLFGIEYDSRLIVGKDILSNSEGIAMTNCNRSFVCDLGKYNAANGKFTPFEGVEVPDGYVARMKKKLNDMITYSQQILINDYYKLVFKKCGLYS